MKETIITKGYLRENPDHIFIFGDNLIGEGKGGAAILRDEPNAQGFVTKKLPNNNDDSFYHVGEYASVYEEEIKTLKDDIENNPDLTFLISRLGAGLANKYHIYEEVIQPRIRKDLAGYANVQFLWED